MRLGALLLACCLFAQAQARDGQDAARRAFHGDPHGWPAAFMMFKADAVGGDARAAYYLGLMYRNGMGTGRDSGLAAHWLGVAAAREVPAAMFTLANMLRAGEGLARDETAARKWLEAAAEREYPEALQQMALAEPDPARAGQLMKEAAHAMTHREP